MRDFPPPVAKTTKTFYFFSKITLIASNYPYLKELWLNYDFKMLKYS